MFFMVSLAWGAWTYRHVFTTEDRPTQNATPPAVVVTTGAPPTTPILSPSEHPAPVQASWGSDPFNRPWRLTRAVSVSPGAVVRKSALKLSAIVVRPDKRYAIINGTIVREGDSVAGRRVTRIESSMVYLDDQGVEVTLTL